MKIEALRKLCVWWQKELRLEHIDIHVRYAEKRELFTEWGRTTRGDDSTHADIVICPPEFCSQDTHCITDTEVILVHELMHVREEWDGEPKWIELRNSCKTIYLMHERGIERTAQALVRLRRKAK